MPAFKVGDRVCHPEHGEGTVTFVAGKYAGIEFDGKRDALLRTRDAVWRSARDRVIMFSLILRIAGRSSQRHSVEGLR